MPSERSLSQSLVTNIVGREQATRSSGMHMMDSRLQRFARSRPTRRIHGAAEKPLAEQFPQRQRNLWKYAWHERRVELLVPMQLLIARACR
jgi:hypothetical protein